MLNDVRLAVRRLSRERSFSVMAVLALALGIGSSTVVFSLFYNLLVAPFPYRDADRLITFSIRNLTGAGSSVGRSWFTPPELSAFREQNHVFEDLAGSSVQRSNNLYSRDGGTRVSRGSYVTGNLFEFYGVPPLAGRAIGAADVAPGAPPVFVVNYRFWLAEFGGDPSVLGTTLAFNGVPRTLVGIMPPRFDIDHADIWMPIDGSSSWNLGVVGRLKPGQTLQAAASDLDLIAHRFTAAEPGFVLNPARYTIAPVTLADAALGRFRVALFALIAAAFMLLAISCLNVANLLLARATVRQRELAVHAALGASWWQLIRQALAESVVLAVLGCVLGCTWAAVGIRALSAMLPADTVPAEAVISLNGVVLAAAVITAALAALACAAAPALQMRSRDLLSRLEGGTRIAGVPARGGRLRTMLVVTEVALSMVLLIGGGLAMRSFFTLTRVDLPFDPAHTLYARLSLPRPRYYSTPDIKPEFFDRLLARVRTVPGVVDATESLMLPPNEGSWTDIAIPGRPHTERWPVDMELCTDGYFRTLGMRLEAGRLLAADDVARHRQVIVVNRALALRYFGDAAPLGQTIKFEVLDRPFVDGPRNAFFEIVGVVADMKTRPSRTAYVLNPTAYLPASVAGFGEPLHLLVKTAGDPHAILDDVVHAVWAVDPEAAVRASGSIADFLSDEFRAPRFEFATLGAFGATGLVLVAIGVFSVMAYIVSIQRHAIAVRLAVGADPGAILRMVITKGLLMIGAGMAVGLPTAFGLTRFISSLLWGVVPSDPWTVAAAAGTILAVGVLACWWPARRAAMLDPVAILREQ